MNKLLYRSQFSYFFTLYILLIKRIEYFEWALKEDRGL